MLEKFNNRDSYLITAIGDMRGIKPENGREFRLKELQDAVDGYIEAVRTNHPDYILIVNEEGAIRNLPVNELASMLAGQVILGDVVLIP